ncbi:DNA polymerase III subunit gamma/tau [Marinobacter sp. V034]|uniref:DNA polymerase III subunit gamma/tau n=1 Tax=Marinobacter sp. V034 TaxID=3459610 RepID=UPI0040447049
MSYQVLARKWRPKTFQDMVGQEHVLKALVHALDHQRLHHAYLFTGTRGVGKTTIGRLLARCLNCETGITSTPCGECNSCQEILGGRFVDLIEIDAASRTKVEDMRELLDNVQYAPTRGRFKIYLIDEVHMLSNSSFNALLKTLEEPPEHVKFLFATTDPQKLPVTILSRCLQFNLKRMTPEHIVGHLNYVLKEETIPFEDPALWLLARAADGSMRDALSLTDQAIAFGNQKLAASDVSAMLGTIDQRDIQEIVEALVKGDGPAMLTEIARIADFSPDYSMILSDLLSLFHRITLEQVVPGSADNALGDADQVKELAKRLCAEDAQLFYQAALIGRKDLAITPDARMGFEMAMLRMLAFRPGSDRREPPPAGQSGASSTPVQQAKDEPDPATASPDVQPKPIEPVVEPVAEKQPVAAELSQQPAAELSPAPVSVEPEIISEPESPASESAAEPQPAVSEVQGNEPAPGLDDPQQDQQPRQYDEVPLSAYDDIQVGDTSVDDEQPVPVVTEETEDVNAHRQASDTPIGEQGDPDDLPEPPVVETEVVEEVSRDAVTESGAGEKTGAVGSTEPAAVTATDAAVAPADFEWQRDFRVLGLTGMAGNLAGQGAFSKEGDTISITLDSGHARLLNDRHRSRISDVLNEYFGETLKLVIIEGAPGEATPSAFAERARLARQKAAESAIADDPYVQRIVSEFDGQIVDGSIEPVG